MNRVKWLWLTVMLLFSVAWAAPSFSQPAGEGEAVLVGRISDVEGQLLRYVPSEKDWVATVKDAPFGLDDALYSDQDSKAEFIMPNNTWLRTAGDTQIQLIALKPDVTVVDVASGITRFFARGSNVVIQATTPFGYVMAQPGSAFDLYVGDQSAEVIALSGKVDFVHDATGGKYEVVPGSSSIIADSKEVAPGEGNVDADWDDWNVDREDLWSKRLAVRGQSTNYLPAPIQDDAYALDENGSWDTVEYEGRPRTFWRPTRVGPEWAPFSVGRWTEWYGDNCWVPDEPFGYVTHHYGNWVFVNNYWYWAPPAVGVSVGVAPVAGIGLGWYPGRVAWISSGANVGWIPLAPAEPYYCHRYWGPRGIVVENPAAVSININRFSYVGHAVVIGQNNFFSVNNYSRVRITNINRTTIVNNFHPAPLVNNTVVNNYSGNRQRYNFTNVNVVNKPHSTVMRRIEQNERLARQEGPKFNADAIRRNVAGTKQGSLAKQAAVQPPKITNKIVPADQVNKPPSQVRFQEKEIKQKTRPAREVQGQGPSQRTGQERQPATMQPGEKGQAGRQGAGQERITPPRPDQRGRQGEQAQPGTMQPGRRGPGGAVEQGQPGRPGQMVPGQDRGNQPRLDQKLKPGESGPAPKGNQMRIQEPQKSKTQEQTPANKKKTDDKQ